MAWDILLLFRPSYRFLHLYYRVIPCKGSRYPPTLPRPVVHILQFELPLCDLDTEKGKMEVDYL